MTTKVAPWLEGLSEAWEIPQNHTAADKVSSESHGAQSLRSSRSRIPRRSLSGLPSSLSNRTTSSQTSTQKRRDPLASISNNDANTFRRQNGTKDLAGTRSVSATSNGSMEAYGTVARRSKSASPSKNQETLEWKRRLVRGEMGYGDQTDLFGPSGLENIFSRSKGSENDAPKPKNRLRWLPKSDVPMPSSPPPWPSSLAELPQSSQGGDEKGLQSIVEDERPDDNSNHAYEGEEDFRSNPFDLRNSDSQPYHHHELQSTSPCGSSPNKAFIESTQPEMTHDRAIGGQTELEQEDLSPVFISKHKTVGGQVDYMALDSHLVKQFRGLNANLTHPSQEEFEAADEDFTESHSERQIHSSFANGLESDTLPVAPDVSFPENLPTGSPFPNLGTNVEVKRGGYSQYGSFKERPLSPSQSTAESSLNLNASGDQKQPLSEGQRPVPAKTPTTPASPKEPKSRSSGSPLKLFGTYDTFTNNQLLRRISQLNPDGTIGIRSTGITHNRGQGTHNGSNGSSFGNGELDNHAFNAEITITSALDSDKSGSDHSPGSEIAPPGSKTPQRFRFETSAEVFDTFKMRRKMSNQGAAASRGSTTRDRTRLYSVRQAVDKDDSQGRSRRATATEQDERVMIGKRPPASPFKNPTPKRRRTLHASEVEIGTQSTNQSYRSQLQERVSSRKRKDARQGESHHTARPEVLAQRKILRPRNPTPSQRHRQLIRAELKEAAEEFAEQQCGRLEAMMEEIESSIISEAPPAVEHQAKSLASQVAAFTMKVQKPSEELADRKRSVTTQDFLDEAMMVMNLIRAKARPQSNLGSVEESDGEVFRESVRIDGSRPDESLRDISRPPSRENSGWRPRAQTHTDARVVSYLRKFQDEERTDADFMANSIASLRVTDEVHVNDQVVVVDEHSNIRITRHAPESGNEKVEDSRPALHRSQGSAPNTQNSNGTSTGPTIGTSSTRKSENVGTLAPDAVAHLIGDQVGGMTFDKGKQCWVRVLRSPEKNHGSLLELPSTVTSDDDPFREISDLPVDEQNELRRISSPAKVIPGQATVDDNLATHEDTSEKEKQQPESRTSSQETVIPRPFTRDSSHNRPDHSSSVPSRYTAFASSQQQERVETRATSWSDEELAKMSDFGKAETTSLAYATAYVATAQRPPNRNVFPALSKLQLPKNIATIDHAEVQPIVDEDDARGLSNLLDDTALELTASEIEDIASPKLRQTPSTPAFPRSSNHKSANRQMSLRHKAWTNRFKVEAHEQSELSILAPLPGDRLMSLSLSVSRPVSTRHAQQHGIEWQPSPLKGDSSFILSDLPDFTMHGEDDERPSERALATRIAQHAAAEVNDRYALAVKELVRILTDVNEDEPYWEDLMQLDLHHRSLPSLQGLDSFCTRVQNMDVSDNALTLLNGAPATIRRLQARSNQLSNLTPWNHLMNLQYLDVSDNCLESLDGLGCLLHLRELRADKNDISSITGVFGLDGLLKLSLRRNKVQQIDFHGTQLERLTHLDLSDNRIGTIQHLENLLALEDLKFDGNNLIEGLRVHKPFLQLTSLSLQSCNIEYLDVSFLRGLKRLRVDENRLSNIAGITQLKDLNFLSMRKQALPDATTLSIFEQPLEARSIRLSGNALPALHLSQAFLNLQCLEIASVGLQALPRDFGLRMPNLRTLNLNFNGLKDIRPLLNIQKLENLSVCSNRLHRLRKSIATFAKLTSLRTLDLRDNPLTQGFYANLASTMSKHKSVVRTSQGFSAEDEGEQAAALDISRYELPAASAGDDKQYRAHLDEDTELRRRVYEVLLANSCCKLDGLDGLEFNRQKAVARDSIWSRLVDLGIIKRSLNHLGEQME